jgi:hypothetical protein
MIGPRALAVIEYLTATNADQMAIYQMPSLASLQLLSRLQLFSIPSLPLCLVACLPL